MYICIGLLVTSTIVLLATLIVPKIYKWTNEFKIKRQNGASIEKNEFKNPLNEASECYKNNGKSNNKATETIADEDGENIKNAVSTKSFIEVEIVHPESKKTRQSLKTRMNEKILKIDNETIRRLLILFCLAGFLLQIFSVSKMKETLDCGALNKRFLQTVSEFPEKFLDMEYAFQNALNTYGKLSGEKSFQCFMKYQKNGLFGQK